MNATPTSFNDHILPMFKPADIACMTRRGWPIDSYAFVSDPAGDHLYPDHANARTIYGHLSGEISPRMPPRPPFWTDSMLVRFEAWMNEGFLP
jgi:hypothetical protein